MTIQRRSFLATVGGGMAWLGTRQLAAAADLKEFTFAVVSDTHLGRQDSATPERQWRQAIEELNSSPAAFVLHLGDVVDGGREAQYPLYVAARGKLTKPIYEVPGNHDPHDLFTRHVRSPIDTTFDHGGVRFILLGNAHTDSHLGFITAEQIAWLGEQCAAAAKMDLKIVVCCHVPIHTNAHPDRGWHVKPADGQSAFYELLDSHADRFLACLHGHFHNGIRGWRDRQRVVEVLFPSLCYNQSRNLEQHLKDGKTQGFFVEELRPGYVLATLGRGRLTLRYKPIGEDIHGEYAAEWS